MAAEELGSGSWSGDDDFDDDSLLRWKKYQLRKREGHHPVEKIKVVRATKRKANEGVRNPHPATTNLHTSTGINSSSHTTAFAAHTGSSRATAVKKEPFSSGLPRSAGSVTVEECTVGNRKEEKTEDEENAKIRRRSKIGTEVEEDCVEGHACKDAEEPKRNGELLASPDRLRTCASICPSIPNDMEIPLTNSFECMLSSNLSLREQQSLSCSMSHVHTHTVCSVHTSSCTGDRVFTAQSQSESPVLPSPTSPVRDYSASDYHRRRRRGWVGKETRGGNSEPVVRGVQRRRGRGMGSQTGQRRASLQTSLFQFASTVHRSVSDTLRAQWQSSSASTSGLSDPTQLSLVQSTSEAHGSGILIRMEGESSGVYNVAVPTPHQRSGRGGSSGVNRECPAVVVVSGCGGGYEVGCSVVQEREMIAVTTTVGSGGAVQRGAVESGRGRGWRRGRRPCPFYKRVPESGMVVDAFSYGTIPNCPAYFLSHFHADHYMGLTRHFQHPIYCSQVTTNLVQHVLKIPGSVLHPLHLHTPCSVNGAEVILIDANHCPGSVMFLFKMPSGRNYLHTGDLRFFPGMSSNSYLQNLTIHQLFLDTTYLSPQYLFPTQQEVISFAVSKAQEAIRRNPHTLIISGTYTIGKEKVFLALAEALESKICVSKQKEGILSCLEWPALQLRLTTDPLSASVHVQPMKKLNLTDMSLYLDSLCSSFSHILAFSPTGWCHSSTRSCLSAIQPKTRGMVTIYGIPYSEHSSFSELRSCVQQLKPHRIIPTVGNQSAQKRKEMERCSIVDFLHSVCENLHLSRNTRFLAMLLVDRFMDKHIIMDYRLKLVTLTCLLVSSKFEEHEERTVCMEQLQILAQCSELPDIYSKDEFLMMELYLLKFFDWSVSYPTASYFLEYFLSNDEEEEEEGGEEEYLVGLTHPHPPPLLQDREERRVQLERLTGCFLEASLRETLFLQLSQSLVAAAVLCASRICLGLPTAWNHRLDILTGYTLNQISTTVDHMLKLFYNDCDM